MSGTTNLDSANAYAGTSNLWKPRLQVYLGAEGIHAPQTPANKLINTALSAQVLKSNWYQADRHKITFSLWGNEEFGYKFWTDFQTMSVLVKIGFEGVVDFTEVFRGFTDKVVIDPIKGIVTLTGRNIFGVLLDGKNIQADSNKSIQQMLDDSFQKNNLPPPVFDEGLDASVPYGRYWSPTDEQNVNSQGDQSTLNPGELVHKVCTQLGAFFYEDSETHVLHFAPEIIGNKAVANTGIAPQPTYELPGLTKLSASNATSLTIEHDLNIAQWSWFAQGISYDSTGVAKSSYFPDGGQNADNAKSIGIFAVNMKAEDTAQHAQSMLTEFVLKEWLITYKVAGPQLINPLLKLQDSIAIEGTDTIVDGPYLIDSIEHSIDFHRGYVGTVKGRYGGGGGGPLPG